MRTLISIVAAAGAVIGASFGASGLHAQTSEQSYAQEAQAEFDLRKDLYAAYGDGDHILIFVSNHHISVGWPFTKMSDVVPTLRPLLTKM
jgi:hypothetical protein